MNIQPTNVVSLTDWDRVRAMKDEDIDFSDLPEITPDMLKSAVIRIAGKVVPKEMKVVRLPIDREVLAYYQAEAGDDAYWKLINDVLRERMLEEQSATSLYRVIREEPTTPYTTDEE